MTSEDLERQYNARAARLDADELMAAWQARSAAFRRTGRCRLDLAYGPGARERLDLFLAADGAAPLLVYLHGGYWQRGDRAIYSFVAEPFVQAGVNVAIVGYSLCPEVRLGEITGQIQRALAWLWHQAGDLGISRDSIHLAGHSAGGHLTAMAMTTDWPALEPALPRDLVKSASPISGLYELEPLRHTSINDAVGMDADEARRNSPMLMVPLTRAPLLVAVGGGETAEFHRQADSFAACWRGHGSPVERLDVPEADHFDVVNSLADPEGVLFSRVVATLSG